MSLNRDDLDASGTIILIIYFAFVVIVWEIFENWKSIRSSWCCKRCCYIDLDVNKREDDFI